MLGEAIETKAKTVGYWPPSNELMSYFYIEFNTY